MATPMGSRSPAAHLRHMFALLCARTYLSSIKIDRAFIIERVKRLPAPKRDADDNFNLYIRVHHNFQEMLGEFKASR